MYSLALLVSVAALTIALIVGNIVIPAGEYLVRRRQVQRAQACRFNDMGRK